jgi:hypothetical protein
MKALTLLLVVLAIGLVAGAKLATWKTAPDA